MARIYQIESDSLYDSSPVIRNRALVYLAYQDGRLVHRARLSDSSFVTVGPYQDLSNYYTIPQTDLLLQRLSDSFHTSLESLQTKLSDSYYTKSQVDDLIEGGLDPQNYYTKSQVDSFISQLSDSLQTKMRLPSNEGTPGQVLRRTVQGWIWDNAGSTSTDLSDYYTKAQTQELLDQLSDSIRSTVYTKVQTDTLLASKADYSELSNYYTKAQTDAIAGALSDSLHGNYFTKSEVYDLISGTSYQTFDEVTDNKVYFIQKIPVGVKTNRGSYYPVQKGSIQISDSLISLDVTPYLVYDGQSSFQGQWTAYFSQGGFTKDQVQAMIQQALEVFDAPKDGKLYGRRSGQWVEISYIPQPSDSSSHRGSDSSIKSDLI